jgi:hypothetical protein
MNSDSQNKLCRGRLRSILRRIAISSFRRNKAIALSDRDHVPKLPTRDESAQRFVLGGLKVLL